MIHLGYPPYFADILGVAKLLAAVALIAPGFLRLKEWAYAGITFNMLGAIASHAASGDGTSGDGISDMLPPAVFAAITFVSWALRDNDPKTASI